MNAQISITLPVTAIQSAPDAVRAWLLSALNLPPSTSLAVERPTNDTERAEYVQLGVARLSDVQTRLFLQGVQSDKTRQALKAMCELGPRFKYLDFLTKMGLTAENWDDFRGVWAGLTKRTRTVTGDKSAHLIDWLNFDSEDADAAMGEMDPGTVGAFRRAFGI